ncbi:hypothetical protein GWI33_010794, partial [Rhynchophorus ferrugineus]
MKIVAFNKPFDVHSQFRGEDNQITLAQFIHDPALRVAGRLDRDSEGLMLLTDHGILNQHITHPKFKQYKTYIAQVEGDVSDTAIRQLQQGIELNDGITLPAKVKRINEPEWLWERHPPIRFRANIPTTWLEIQICEGRNRQDITMQGLKIIKKITQGKKDNYRGQCDALFEPLAHVLSQIQPETTLGGAAISVYLKGQQVAELYTGDANRDEAWTADHMALSYST